MQGHSVNTTYLRVLILVPVQLAMTFAVAADRVRTEAGVVEGAHSTDGKVRTFKGIPYAAPPLGALRWKAPQPVKGWDGVRKATEFGPRCLQGNNHGDMGFRDAGPSEDCLYLNVWTPRTSAKTKLPVMVWIHGGWLEAGSASMSHYDGECLARKGVVLVSMNYRLGVFGFFSHPDLTKESKHHASGNYGLMDQAAALQWVRRNIAGFGGDPKNITIFGESSGSFSVAAQMASPMARGLVAKAIGESGGYANLVEDLTPLAVAEQEGIKFAHEFGARSLEQLRAVPAQQLLDAVMKFDPTRLNIDGRFFPVDPRIIYDKGEQAQIPLLAGWNRDEFPYENFLGKDAPTRENYETKVRKQFGAQAPVILGLFPGHTDGQVKQSAARLGSMGVMYSTWLWLELQSKSRATPVYRYQFDMPRPLMAGAPPIPNGREALVPHWMEIPYVFGTFDTLATRPWTTEDYQLGDLMEAYWTNFAKTGDPNGKGLPRWPAYRPKDAFQVMHLGAGTYSQADDQREQFLELEKVAKAVRMKAGK